MRVPFILAFSILLMQHINNQSFQKLFPYLNHCSCLPVIIEANDNRAKFDCYLYCIKPVMQKNYLARSPAEDKAE